MAVSLDQDGETTTVTTKEPQPQPHSDNTHTHTNDNNDPKQQKQQTTTDPNQKPPTPTTETFRSLLLLTLTLLDTYLFPTPRTRTTVHHFLHTHPFLSTFLAAQLLVSFFPLFLFATLTMTAGVVAAGLFACLGLVVLVPVLVATGVLGVVVWGWGWGVFVVGRWAWGAYVERMVRDGAGGSSSNGNRNGPIMVKSEKVEDEKGGNGEGDGKKWQFKAGFGDKWIVFG